MKKKLFQTIKDFVFMPVRFFFNHQTVEKLGLTSIQEERFNVCLPFIKGEVLDVGCGPGNKFIKKLGQGIGLDPNFSEKVDVVAEVEKMPFPDKKFQTITMMVSLRYFRDKDKAMKEVFRVLSEDGRVLILENHPFLNKLRQMTIWWDPYKKMKSEQGMIKKDIVDLAQIHNFRLVKTVRYLYGLSVMYVLYKKI